MRFYKEIEKLLAEINVEHLTLRDQIISQNIKFDNPLIIQRLDMLFEHYEKQLLAKDYDYEKEIFEKAFIDFQAIADHKSFDLYLCYYHGSENKVYIQYLDRNNEFEYVDELDLFLDFSGKFLSNDQIEDIFLDDFYEISVGQVNLTNGWVDKFRLQYYIELKKMLIREFSAVLKTFPNDFSIYIAPYDDSEYVLLTNSEIE